MLNIECPYCHYKKNISKENYFKCVVCNNEFNVMKNKVKLVHLNSKSKIDIIERTVPIPSIYFLITILFLKYKFISIQFLFWLGVLHPLILFPGDIAYYKFTLLELYIRFIKERGSSFFNIPDKCYFFSSLFIFIINLILIVLFYSFDFGI